MIVNVICPQGFDCPTSEEVSVAIFHGCCLLTSFPGSSEGTPGTIVANVPYGVNFGYVEPAGLDSIPRHSSSCTGQLAAGESATCFITITFFVES